MTVPDCPCWHVPMCHAYRPATRRNDGPCLVRGCKCRGAEEAS